MIDLVFLKLKRGLWFSAAFMLILLFSSIPLKHYLENQMMVLTAFILSIIILPIYTYKKRIKNSFFLRIYRSRRFDNHDSCFDKFKKSPFFIHFKAEIIAATFYSVLLVAGCCYYIAKGNDPAYIVAVAIICTAISMTSVILLDFLVWNRCFAYWERHKNLKIPQDKEQGPTF